MIESKKSKISNIPATKFKNRLRTEKSVHLNCLVRITSWGPKQECLEILTEPQIAASIPRSCCGSILKLVYQPYDFFARKHPAVRTFGEEVSLSGLL